MALYFNLSKQVRTKKKPVTDINFTLVENMGKELNEFLQKMIDVEEKLNFIKTIRTRTNIEFLLRQKSIDDLLIEPSINLYIFFYDDDLKFKQPNIYNAHMKRFIQMSGDTNNKLQSRFVIVDMDLHPQASAQREIKIRWYKNKQLESTDLLKEKPQNNASTYNYAGKISFVGIP